MYGSANHRSDMPDEWKRYGMPEMIGDQARDADQLKATSPIEQAARIRAPLLLAYGGADVRVPIVHGTSSTRPSNVTIRTSSGSNTRPKATAFTCRRTASISGAGVEKFLDKNIGQGAVQ
jgi:hypothetical protein